jgi:hypothetical protein
MNDSNHMTRVAAISLWPRNGDALVTAQGEEKFLAHTVFCDWETYVFSYRQAADALIGRVDADPEWRNFMVMPIVCLYRHYLELRLKSLVWDGEDIDGIKRTEFRNHQLVPLWNRVRSKIEKDEPSCPSADLDAVENVIKQFEDLDENSQAARYPTDRSGNQSKVLAKEINLKTFWETVTGIANFLERCSDQYDEWKRYLEDARP